MPITPQEALLRCIEHREIFHDEMLSLFRSIMSGDMSPVMVAALTMGLRVKKETIGEITAAAQVMREFATKVQLDDTSGRQPDGGDHGQGERLLAGEHETALVLGHGGELQGAGSVSGAPNVTPVTRPSNGFR